MLTRHMGTLHMSLRVLRVFLVLGGAIGGALLPFLAREMATPDSANLMAWLDDGWFDVVVHAAYGALAGWAIGALVAYLLGER